MKIFGQFQILKCALTFLTNSRYFITIDTDNIHIIEKCQRSVSDNKDYHLRGGACLSKSTCAKLQKLYTFYIDGKIDC